MHAKEHLTELSLAVVGQSSGQNGTPTVYSGLRWQAVVPRIPCRVTIQDERLVDADDLSVRRGVTLPFSAVDHGRPLLVAVALPPDRMERPVVDCVRHFGSGDPYCAGFRLEIKIVVNRFRKLLNRLPVRHGFCQDPLQRFFRRADRQGRMIEGLLLETGNDQEVEFVFQGSACLALPLLDPFLEPVCQERQKQLVEGRRLCLLVENLFDRLRQRG